MENLGPIGVTFATVEDAAALQQLMRDVTIDVPAGAQRLDRIVLIVPAWVADRLGWRTDRAPVAALYQHDLVFTPPD